MTEHDPYRVMTVCTGNICRSPMAEVVLRARFAEAGLADRVVVDSTGISDEERGNPIDRRARTALAARGYEVPGHAARQTSVADLREHDLVLAMTSSHARALRRLGGTPPVTGCGCTGPSTPPPRRCPRAGRSGCWTWTTPGTAAPPTSSTAWTRSRRPPTGWSRTCGPCSTRAAERDAGAGGGG